MDERLRLRLEVDEFYAEYAACLDEERLEAWPELFTEQCLYRVTTRENFERRLPLGLIYCESRGMLQDRVAALRKTTVYAPRSLRHMISGVRLTAIAVAELRVQSSFVVFETARGGGTQILCAGTALDCLQRGAGRLLLSERLCVLDTEMIPGSLVYPL